MLHHWITCYKIYILKILPLNCIFSMFAKFQSDQRLITMSLINCLNSNFCSLKLCIKDEFMCRMVNYIQLALKLACMLRIYRICNSMIGFSKYKFYNKLLNSVTLLRVISGVTWTQPYIYIYRESC